MIELPSSRDVTTQRPGHVMVVTLSPPVCQEPHASLHCSYNPDMCVFAAAAKKRLRLANSLAAAVYISRPKTWKRSRNVNHNNTLVAIVERAREAVCPSLHRKKILELQNFIVYLQTYSVVNCGPQN